LSATKFPELNSFALNLTESRRAPHLKSCRKPYAVTIYVDSFWPKQPGYERRATIPREPIG